MKKLKLIIGFILLIFCSFTSYAQDYEIKYNREDNICTGNWQLEYRSSSNVILSSISLEYDKAKDLGCITFRIQGSEEATWPGALASRIDDPTSPLRDIHIYITLSNGTKIYSILGLVTIDINDYVMREYGLGSIAGFTATLLTQISIIGSEKECATTNEIFSLLRTYNITSLTIDGQNVNLSGLNTAYHINAILNEFAKKGAYHSSSQGNTGNSNNPNNVNSVKPAQDVEFQKITVDYDKHNKDGEWGMIIKATFSTQGLKGVKCKLIAYFYQQDGTPLKDHNNNYCTQDGKVSVSSFCTPSYENSKYTDFELFIPYNELHLNQTKGTVHHLKFFLQLYDTETHKFVGNNKKSEDYKFTISY